MWNRWCTARRFQEDGTCVFGCPGEAQDSIEHYAHCPSQVSFARTKLHIPAEHSGSLQAFMCLNKNVDDDLRAILVINLYACYAARNAMKHHHDPQACFNVAECMLQFAKQAVFGHAKSRDVFARWVQVPNRIPLADSRAPRGESANRWISGGTLGPWQQ